MGQTTKSIKVLVPKGISREKLIEFAQMTIREQLLLKHFRIETVSPSHSKSEQENEATYRVTFTHLMLS
jgi:hypothetical protein